MYVRDFDVQAEREITYSIPDKSTVAEADQEVDNERLSDDFMLNAGAKTGPGMDNGGWFKGR